MAGAEQPVAVPLVVRSSAANPVTLSLNVTSKTTVGAFVMPSVLLRPLSLAAWRAIVTVGAWRSTVHVIAKPDAVVAVLPARSLAPNVPLRFATLVFV